MSWPSFWLQADWRSTCLKPLSWWVCRIAKARLKGFETHPPQSPGLVIVVGNIVVGGTGKTPFIIWLVKRLTLAGYRVGVIARGVGGKASSWPQIVTEDSKANEVGDEPVLLAQKLGCPVVVAPKRAQALERLLKDFQVDMVISDDGLQHYELARDIELVMLDASRPNQGLGNGLCLPAGPLREPISRLSKVDFVVFNGMRPDELNFKARFVGSMQLKPVRFVSVLNAEIHQSISAFKGQQGYAVAGIGHPERFYASLMSLNIETEQLSFPDHHAFRKSDFAGLDPEKPLFMTSKDAVKCKSFAKGNWWVLEVEPTCDPALEQALMEIIKQGLQAKTQ
ncbi:tetraacyldisaccharide 4'-kinase [Thiomicrospira microaerophila]|uniref:tetraacyldisaccharide 4'-kinase n=1 Tax=Thiomicrospira microaerophila TaxID=406020 RepID=UPI0020103823|nr:tetraacyldisaccharide 4'-kinase [Thiomicrospira microaerophila]UQB41407.1 tetraacyldisaccharide 4'-kinase [Thiomicrospira microaerophila]